MDQLLATKLHVPRARGGVVRPRLAERLTEGLAGELTLVCAPAGFGKTALLADWARRGGRVVAWLSLDAADNDATRFWRHFAAAIDGARAGADRDVPVPLRPPRLSEAAVAALVNELAAAPGQVVLILDDYHQIESQAVHQSLGLLLGTSFEPRNLGLMFGFIVLPITFLGGTYYQWTRLASVKLGTIHWLQIIVLVNPLIYINDGMRAAFTNAAHMHLYVIYPAILAFSVLFLTLGLKNFRRKVLA